MLVTSSELDSNRRWSSDTLGLTILLNDFQPYKIQNSVIANLVLPSSSTTLSRYWNMFENYSLLNFKLLVAKKHSTDSQTIQAANELSRPASFLEELYCKVRRSI